MYSTQTPSRQNRSASERRYVHLEVARTICTESWNARLEHTCVCDCAFSLITFHRTISGVSTLFMGTMPTETMSTTPASSSREAQASTVWEGLQRTEGTIGRRDYLKSLRASLKATDRLPTIEEAEAIGAETIEILEGWIARSSRCETGTGVNV